MLGDHCGSWSSDAWESRCLSVKAAAAGGMGDGSCCRRIAAGARLQHLQKRVVPPCLVFLLG